MKLPVQTRGLLWLIVVSAAVAMILDWSVGRDRVAAPDPRVDKYNPLPVQRAQASLPALFSSDDYPLAALNREEQGTVAFALAVDEGGRVEQCYITASSGSANLDRATCNILVSRARFAPARDAAGQAVADLATGRIKWQLPPE